MSKEVDGELWLTSKEVQDNPEYGWSREMLYRAARNGLLEGKKFFGDKQTYWRKKDLDTLKNKEDSKKYPKSEAPSEINRWSFSPSKTEARSSVLLS